VRRDTRWWRFGLVGGFVFGLIWIVMGFLIYGEVRFVTGILGWATWFATSYFLRDAFERR
jgi:hypothetical protein